MASSSHTPFSYAMNRIRYATVRSPQEFRKCLQWWTNSRDGTAPLQEEWAGHSESDVPHDPRWSLRPHANKEQYYNLSILVTNAEGKGEKGFHYDPDIQFRVSITFPTKKNQTSVLLVDNTLDDDQAFLSYHELLRTTGKRTFFQGCLNTESKSNHMVNVIRQIISRNQSFSNYEELEKELGSTCPGLDRYRQEAFELNHHAAYASLYHRCAVLLAQRLEFTYSMANTEETMESDTVGEQEFVQDTGHDLLMEAILCDSDAFDVETSEQQNYPYNVNDFTRQFFVLVNYDPVDTEDQEGKNQETTMELMVQRNLLAIQTAWFMKTNANMRLESMNVATWERQEKKDGNPSYVQAASIAWLIFSDIEGNQSVAVIHGAHRCQGKLNPEPIYLDVKTLCPPTRRNLKRRNSCEDDDFPNFRPPQPRRRKQGHLNPISSSTEEEQENEDVEDDTESEPEMVEQRKVQQETVASRIVQRRRRPTNLPSGGDATDGKANDLVDNIVKAIDLFYKAFKLVDRGKRFFDRLDLQ